MTKRKPQIPWTSRQDKILREFGTRGVKACQRELQRAGVNRSVHSIQIRASRIGVSLARQMTCPGCGHIGSSDDFANHTGLCKVCNTQRLIDKQIARNEQKRREVTKHEFDTAVKSKSREYARLRKEHSRIGRNGDSSDEKVRMKVRIPRSEQRKIFSQESLF